MHEAAEETLDISGLYTSIFGQVIKDEPSSFVSAHHNRGKGRGNPAHRLHACLAFYLYGLLGQLTGKLIGR